MSACARLCLLLALGLAAAAPVAAADEPEPRLVTVSGSGEARAMPDRAQLSLGVEARGETLPPLRETVNDSVAELLALAESLEIEPAQVTATGIRIRPEYERDPSTGERRFAGYYVVRQVEVELRDLERLAELIEGAVDRGVNRLSEPVLEVTEREALRRQALGRAAADARRNAETVAAPLDAAVGSVYEIRAVEHEQASPRPMLQAESARAVTDAGGAAAAAAFEAGEITFRAQLTARFELQPH